jgi:PAS domain S-box-containing protein
MKAIKFPSAVVIENLPWWARALLGVGAACFAEAVNYSIVPLRAFPFILVFPTIIFSCWYLDMWGGLSCALSDVVLLRIFIIDQNFRFPNNAISSQLRITVFLAITILLGWAMRRLAQQRAQLSTHELQERLLLANAERQLAEERARISEAVRDRDEVLQLALQANGMGLWVWDLEHGTSNRSDEMYRMVGRTPESVTQACSAWFDLIHPDDLEAVKEAVGQTHSIGKDYHMQYRVVLPDGSIRWLESQGKCQHESDGTIRRVIGVIADVTNRKLTEEAMLRAEKLAIAGRLAASVAHEINNPLEAVMNLLFLITLADNTEDARTHARHALDELVRISLITQQTLKFHRQTGTPTVIRLSEIVVAVLTLFRGKLRSAQIASAVRGKQEVSVACMPSEMQQIFANLVSNAIEAMPGGGQLIVRLRPSRDWRDGTTLGMRVTFFDTGIGMSRATMRHIFEPFFTTKKETGTGLGMWVVAQLAERRNVHVRVWSTERPGSSGTAITVFLPLVSPTDTAPVESHPEERVAAILEM